MRSVLTGLLALLWALTAFAQDDQTASDEAAEEATGILEEFDREPVRCISIPRIDRTEVIDERTVLFHMRGRQIYRNRLAIDCPRLVREKRFSYDVRTTRLCDVDYITVLERWGSAYQQGMSCGLGLFYPITEEEAEFLDIEPDEMLESQGVVEETAGDETPSEASEP